MLLGFFPCPIYQVFGIPCPTCGITRAYKLFLTGHFADAFSMHPLFLLPLIFLLKPFRKKWILIFIIILFVILYIIRFYLLFPDIQPFNYNYNSVIGEFLK